MLPAWNAVSSDDPYYIPLGNTYYSVKVFLSAEDVQYDLVFS